MFMSEAEISVNRSSCFLGSGFVDQKQLMESQVLHQSPGLARYRSAPSSLLAAVVDSNTNSSSGDESEALFSAFWNGSRDLDHKGGDDSSYMKQEIRTESGTPGSGAMFFNGVAGGGANGSYSVGVNGSGLLRQSSSPAGLFTGFGAMGNYSAHRGNSSASDINISSSPSISSSRIMPSILENTSVYLCESLQSRNGEYGAGFNDLKRDHDGHPKVFSTFSGLHDQSGETLKSSTVLVHGEAEKLGFLQFEPDVVPCQIRAKRGCATHPRSIAERMRRTRISEKMKKLQQLFPNIDKQTSTADMLDLAVQYIKDLQRQVQTLTETKVNCICSSQPRATSNQI